MDDVRIDPPANPVRELWDRVLEHVREKVQPKQFELWFRQIEILDVDDETVTLEVPNRFFRDWVNSYYREEIADAVAAETGSVREVRFLVKRDAPLPERHRPRADSSSTTSSSPSRAGSYKSPPPSIRAPLLTTSQLNPRYSFESFVVGPRNQVAHAAALAIAERPSELYNPLFVHGSVGLGKTHVLQAICHASLERRPQTRIAYITCEMFVNSFIAAIESGGLKEFRYQYRAVDVLVVDDIHFLAHKDRTQEEFFHTFNALFNGQRQIVLSSDCPPQAIGTLEERLVSRFRWGLVAEMEPPVFETRISILKRNGVRFGIDLPDDVCEFIASHVTTNIRELEGSIHQVVNYARLRGRPVGLETAREALPHLVSDPRRSASLEDITRVVTSYFGVKVSDVLGKRRTKLVTYPRQISMFIARKLTSHSLQEIGGYFGGRDHTTVMHAINKIGDLVKAKSEVRNQLDHFLTVLR